MTADSPAEHWSGATLPSIGFARFELAIDVADGLAAFHPAGVSSFTLRQTPIPAAAVPAPSTLLLLGLPLLGLAWRQLKPTPPAVARAAREVP